MKNYHEYGYDHGQPCHTQNYLWQPVINLINPKGAILDLGCGNGAFANTLIQKGLDVYGTDASTEGIAQAKKIHPRRFFVQNVDTQELPPVLSRKRFKTIVSTEVIEHLYDPRTFVALAKQILLKNGGGDFILSTPYHGYLKNLTISLTDKWDTHANPLWDGGHIKLWSKKTLTALLKEQGFKITNFVGCGRFPYLWKSMVIKASISPSN